MRQYCTRALVLALAVLVIGCSTADGAKEGSTTGLPAAPSGFRWYETANGVGSFLLPDGWFAKEESKGNTKALFISKENIDVSDEFSTGLSVNQINSWPGKPSVSALEYARNFILKINDKMEVIKTGVVKGNLTDMNVSRVRG